MENVFGSVTLPPTTSGGPRSRRMDGILQSPPFPPPRTMDFKAITPPVSPKDESLPMLSPSKTPPPPPPRSPLRPSPRSVTSFNTIVDLYTRRDTIATIRTDRLETMADRRKSVASLSALLDQYSLNSPLMLPTPVTEYSIPDALSLLDDKPLPIPPNDDSPVSSPTATINLGTDASETSTVSTLTVAPVITKREHAMKELLSSERAYASDLAFVQNVHIPMALGKSAPFHLPRPITPPRSSSSSARTVSTSSESSNSYYFGPPMTKEDVRTIFGNITELAMFSDMFSERLQEALGDVLEDGKGEDWVGALFLEEIPQMEPPYKTYITRHPNAINHLNSLPQTPALVNYLAQTQSLASSVTHAWDLPSLLIKPVQRLLKYSLLLGTIIDQTPDGHGDKENLREARRRMEEVARGVNEGRRRMEVVKEVLTGRTDVGKPAMLQKKLSIGKSSQVSVGRMKSMSMGLRSVRPKEENDESVHVTENEKQLRRSEAFAREFAKDIIHWAQTVRASQTHLRTWAIDFGKTIGISDEQPSEAFNAFLDVIDVRLMPLCQELDDVVKNELFPELARLLDTLKAPIRLLAAMHSLEHLHYSLLNLNYSKHRPPPSMIEASQNYLALRGQLASDLPKYLELFDKGIVVCIRHFANRQTEFWSTVREQWGALWDCLRMEGETNAGCEETLTLWWSRYSEVDDVISKLNILKRERPAKSTRSWASCPPSGSNNPSMESHSARNETPLPNSTSSFADSSVRHRSVGSLESSATRSIRRSPSMESLPSQSPSHYGVRSRPSTPESVSRSKARSNTSPLPASSSQPSLNMHALSGYPSRAYSMTDQASIDSRSEYPGRKSRSSSFSQKLSETLRAPLRRSPSQKSIASQRSDTSRSGQKRFPTLDLDNSSAPPLPQQGDYFDLMPPPNTPIMYYVTAVHACTPPEGNVYGKLPFFRLAVGDIFGVLFELGHPSELKDLCISVSESEKDYLLIVKGEDGNFGLALASFLEPI